MPDDLDVSGATTAVATEDLEVAVEQLRALSAEAAGLSTGLGMLEPVPAVSLHAQQSTVDLDLARANLAAISTHCRNLSFLLSTVMASYIVSDRMIALEWRALGDGAAHWFGQRLAGLAVMSGLAVSVAGGLWMGLRAAGLGPALAKPFEGVPKASSWWRENNLLATNPVTSTLFRVGTTELSTFMLGAGGLPAHFPGSSTTGARVLIGAGQTMGLFEETPVRLVETQQLPVTRAPSDYVDRLARVPYFESETGPQVVIEKYTIPGEDTRYQVYVGGTVTFSPVTDTEPWDFTSNMMNAAGIESGSVASVRAAMEAAGVDENSPVQFTGYSQGGGTAARLAASGLYNTQGLVTYGGPTGQIPLPDGFPTVLVEHADDPVPALGGEQDNHAAVLVRRDVFGGENIPEKYAVPAHHIEYYLQTARLMDESGSPQLDDMMARLDSFTDGATLESSTAYRFERVEE